MKRFALSRRLAIAISLTCSFATTGIAQWRESRQFPNTVETTLTEVRAHPDAFRNVKVQFEVQFASLGSVANPFFTQFVPTDFANFHAWATEQPIWRKSEFDNMFGLLFVSKSNDQLQDLYKCATFDRMKVVGLVRNTFQNQPWIEVVSFEKLGQRVEWATLGHLYRADQWMQKRQWQQALSELSLASQAKNPDEVGTEIDKAMGVCYLRVGEAAQAVSYLKSARQKMGENSPACVEIENLIASAKVDPTRELDRTVTSTEVREHERPLWEAFEDDRRRMPQQQTNAPAQPQR